MLRTAIVLLSGVDEKVSELHKSLAGFDSYLRFNQARADLLNSERNDVTAERNLRGALPLEFDENERSAATASGSYPLRILL